MTFECIIKYITRKNVLRNGPLCVPMAEKRCEEYFDLWRQMKFHTMPKLCYNSVLNASHFSCGGCACLAGGIFLAAIFPPFGHLKGKWRWDKSGRHEPRTPHCVDTELKNGVSIHSTQIKWFGVISELHLSLEEERESKIKYTELACRIFIKYSSMIYFPWVTPFFNIFDPYFMLSSFSRFMHYSGLFIAA